MKRSVTQLDTKFEPRDEPRTLSEAVYRRLRQDIVWGKLPPNARLRSDELRETYGVGISPLREALSKLSAERLVNAIGQRGFRVAPLSAEDVTDIVETRLVIEREALGRSIRLGGIAWEREVVASFHALSRVPIPRGPGPLAEQWTTYHRQFHMSLLSACESRWQMNLAQLLFDQAERYRAVRALRVPQPKLARDIAGEHKRLFEATIARRTNRAIKALEDHYRTTAEHVVASLRHLPRVRN